MRMEESKRLGEVVRIYEERDIKEPHETKIKIERKEGNNGK